MCPQPHLQGLSHLKERGQKAVVFSGSEVRETLAGTWVLSDSLSRHTERSQTQIHLCWQT